MAITLLSGTIVGVEGHPVAVEVDLLRRLPSISIVGLASNEVKESTERVRSAIQEAELDFPRKRVVVNLAPGDLRKRGTGFDLPIAVGILAADGQVGGTPLAEERIHDTLFLAELSLMGELRPVHGCLPLVLMAARVGAQRVVVADDNAAEAAVVPGLEILHAHDLAQVVGWIEGEIELPRATTTQRVLSPQGPDLSEVRGQHLARRALEVAAAGGHNLLLVGPPGCGKTMLAARMPGILPSLSFDEAIDITRVHSVAGLVDRGSGLVSQRPFRAPHHSISPAGMIGNAHLRPGEASLAHGGVLFLDEVPEFDRGVLELLRSPLEDREVSLCRAAGTVRLPASFSLIASANPCPCGYAGHPTRPCTCAPFAVDRYRGRLSGPLMDRIDLHVWVQPVDPERLAHGEPGEASADVRARVERARAIQRQRYHGQAVRCNAELSGDAIRRAAQPSASAMAMLRALMDRHGLSARAWARILKVARTIADLDGSERVAEPHVLEASSYRVERGEQASA